MIKHVFSFLLLIFIILFFYIVTKVYLSEENIKKKNLNRSKIGKKLSENLSNLAILRNDTNNVIEYNSGFNNEGKDKPDRNFWNLTK